MNVVDPISQKKPKHKFLSSTFPISATSSLHSLNSQSKVSNLTHKNHNIVDWRSMSLSQNQVRTHHVEVEHDNNKHQGNFSKESGKIWKIKASATCICLPGFGKSKQVKARKLGDFQMDHSVDVVMSNTFSLENIELKTGVAQGKGIIVQESDDEDYSRSSYFDLPSTVLKRSSDRA